MRKNLDLMRVLGVQRRISQGWDMENDGIKFWIMSSCYNPGEFRTLKPSIHAG
ncbi:MAG: hypothetical protein FWG14_05835 [Peptococcaceae bacterium]|nr:hypothetical protein [Peptococcaceae bacterium]